MGTGSLAKPRASQNKHGRTCLLLDISKDICPFTNIVLLVYITIRTLHVLFTVGGHINPAVSLALAVCGRFSWASLPFYMISQFVGAFIACAGVFAVYHGEYQTNVRD